MAVVDVLNSKAEKVSQADLIDAIFNIDVKSNVLHEVVKMQLASRRAGSASVKHRSDVRGSGGKLFRQKGTGRARRGDIKAPLLRGGGSVFGPDPRSYAYRVPKKVRKLALRMALSSKLKANNIVVVDKIEMDKIKTKAFVELMEALNTNNALIVTDKKNENLERSARNVPGVKVLRIEGLNVYDILKYENLVLTEPSIKGIEGRLLV
ncbi:MAG: 50S ribosomal protein L4 [Desulfobacterales bacterium]|nr:MAG: 50S ribosomal protein L4 [Desulfobacterales bacterium]